MMLSCCLSLSELIRDQCSIAIGVLFEVLFGTVTFHTYMCYL